MRYASRAAGIFVASVLIFGVAACGTNNGSGAVGASGSPAGWRQSAGCLARRQPGRRPQRRADRLGDGRRGDQARDPRRRLHGGEPGRQGQRDAGRLGPAVAKLQTAIAGNTTPDVSQMGTDMMGQFGATGAFEPVPADIDPERLLRERLEHEHRRRDRVRRALVRRDPAPVLPDRHRREGRHHRAAGDVGRPEGDREGDEGARAARSTASGSVRRTGRSTSRSSGRTAVTSSTRAASRR